MCQHPYLTDPDLEDDTLPAEEQQRLLIDASGKLLFLKQLLPRLKERGHRVLLFSQVGPESGAVVHKASEGVIMLTWQYKIALDRSAPIIHSSLFIDMRVLLC